MLLLTDVKPQSVAHPIQACKQAWNETTVAGAACLGNNAFYKKLDDHIYMYIYLLFDNLVNVWIIILLLHKLA